MRMSNRFAASRRRAAVALPYVTMFYSALTSGESGTGTRTFYIDTGGSNAVAGTSTASAWQTWAKVVSYAASPGFLPGDRILFKRGQNHLTVTGNTIGFSGTVQNPITIGAYGNGAPPAILMNNYSLDAGTGQDSTNTKWEPVFTVPAANSNIVIRDLLISSVVEQDIFVAGINVLGTGVTVDNCEITQASTGVLFNQPGTTNSIVKNCYIHDVKMQTADAAVNNDYGCYGVASENSSGITIHHCTFKNISKLSPDYGLDGNCLEIYANSASISNIVFQNNYVEDCVGISELGGTSAYSVSNVTYDHNVICNANGGIYFHSGGTSFALGSITNVKFTNNTIYKNIANSGLITDAMFGFSSGNGVFLTSQNNIFAVANLDQFDYTDGASTLSYSHSNNLYSLTNVPTRSGYTTATGEVVGDPGFVDVSGRDFRLTQLSAAVARATPLAGYLTDYTGRDLTSRSGLDIGAIESDYDPIPNAAPTDIVLSVSSIAENNAVGAVVGTLSSVDANPGDTHTYTLVSGTGSTDNAAFTVSGNQLIAAVSFDYETKSSYSIRVRSTDSTGLFLEKQIGLTITDVASETIATLSTAFDGTNTSAGRVTFADSASFDMPNASWTLGFMVMVSSNVGSVGNYLFSTGGYQASNSMNVLIWEASSNNPNSFGLAFTGADGTTYQILSPVTASGATSSLYDGTWRLWTVERVKGASTTTFNIYQTPVGGARSLVHSQNADLLTTISPPGGASGVPTLAARALTPTDRYLNGAMYMAFQMDGVLTATEIQNLAAGQDLISGIGKTPKWYVKLTGVGPTFTDLSGNGNTATVAGTVTQTTGPTF